jgi:hypothetical protein
MATFRNRSGKWQARVQIQGHTPLSKTFINKVDAERVVVVQTGIFNEPDVDWGYLAPEHG